MSESYNYIAFGSRAYLVENLNSVSMNRGRVFEYTPVSISKALENLDTASIEFLEKLPTFVCTEIEAVEDGYMMSVRYGKIKDIQLSKYEVKTSFEALADFGDVSFESVDQARQIFGADKFQLYRTHWSVRTGSAQEIIHRLQGIKPDKKFIYSDKKGIEARAKPPEQSKNIVGTANSVEKFLDILQQNPPKEHEESFFRGHENESYELTPSLLRKWKNGAWKHMPNEHKLCQEIFISHNEEFQNDSCRFDRLARMQHYGLPTRLLDVSSNPLVALFFACDGMKENNQSKGEVIILRLPTDAIKYYDSDTVSCISGLSNLSFKHKNEIDLKLNIDDFNQTNVISRLLYHVRADTGHFEAKINPVDLGSIVCVKAKRTNNRIKSQSGAFFLFGHEAKLPEAGQNDISILRITIENKHHIIRQLDAININPMTVYPGIDRTSVHLRQKYQLEDK